MIDKEMRKLIRQFKGTLPIGVRGATQRKMRDVYELADAEHRLEMKDALMVELGLKVKEENPEDLRIPLVTFEPPPHLLMPETP